MTERKIRRRDCVRLSNKIIERCQLPVEPVREIRDIRSEFFVRLLEVLNHRLPPGIIEHPETPSDEVHNVQTIINHLALDLIDVDLSHISGAQVIAGNAHAIYNLLEIFCGLHKYLSSHEIDRWHLEESLTETEEELSTTSSSTPTDSQSANQEDAAAAPEAEAVSEEAAAAAARDSDLPPSSPSRRSSAGVRASASAGSRPPSSARSPPGSAPGSGGGSPSRRLSAGGPGSPAGQTAGLTPSGSGTGPAGAALSPSTKTSTSGGSAVVSFPESQYSLEMELPITKSGSRQPGGRREPREAGGSPAAESATSPSESSPAASSSLESPEDDGEPAAGGGLGDGPETLPETPGDTAVEGDGRRADSLETARSSESAVQDSPTTETGTEEQETGTEEQETGTEEQETGSEETEGETEETPHEPHRFEFIDEQTPETGTDTGAGGDEFTNMAFDADSDLESDEVASVDGTEPDEVDISRQLSEELQQLQQQPATSSGPEQTSSGAEKKERKKSSPGTSSDTTAGRARGGRSAPCGAAVAARRCRSSDRSSVSDPGVNGRRPLCRRLLTRNIETIAEIHESGGERAVTRTTREQAGDKLCKETVQREVRRKVRSAPTPNSRLMSFLSKQSSRRSICSDGVLRWLESQADETYLKVEGEETDVFEFLRREFPYVRVSEETKRKLLTQYRQQMRYIMHLVEPTETRHYKLKRQDVLQRQALLTDIIRQQREHDQRFRRLRTARLQAIKRRNAPRDAKISCLRAQRFVDSFKQQFESRSALNRSREELLMKAVFEEMLEIQRHRLRSVRAFEKRAIREFYGQDGYTAELNRMHQFYEANFRDLAQMLSREKNDLALAEKEQTKLADRIKREFRDYMEADVRSLNDKVVTSWQPQYRELDADKIRSDLYEANWKFCVT
ncbi:centrosomal protein of 95 kDa-like isoform X1 [Amphibalanus amphitrite]|uniref:centrosomal protein of 95 kDa-like isoform X1 n=1 Tax=Amphibalanus amphitrite TaxID=1232801 RepID=UPI001C90EDEF|nr:centrosomal protein of 95 kDa-like isoform X1 [Amphibalanus amphitrite]